MPYCNTLGAQSFASIFALQVLNTWLRNAPLLHTVTEIELKQADYCENSLEILFGE